jgi:hypothetical protein
MAPPIVIAAIPRSRSGEMPIKASSPSAIVAAPPSTSSLAVSPTFACSNVAPTGEPNAVTRFVIIAP